jgi:hypothetical protein
VGELRVFLGNIEELGVDQLPALAAAVDELLAAIEATG